MMRSRLPTARSKIWKVKWARWTKSGAKSRCLYRCLVERPRWNWTSCKSKRFKVTCCDMAKKVSKKIKIVITAGKATPAPPFGTALGPTGINIGEFVTKFNEQTRGMDGLVPAEISIYEDRTFDFVLKTPPASSLILKALGIEK